jgi:ribosomal protein L37AE/L43A
MSKDTYSQWNPRCPKCQSQNVQRAGPIDDDGWEIWSCNACSHTWSEQS